MKTDELITLLSTNLERVESFKFGRNISDAILLGVGAASITAVLILGARTDLYESRALTLFLVKVTFGLGIASMASVYLVKHSQPGGEVRSRISLTALPFLAVMAIAAVNLVLSPRSHWQHMLIGDQWLVCLISIPIIAILPFSLIMWAIRLAAPTNLRRTGALAGLIAGGISASAYALHCTDDSLPFVALWYSGTVVLCTVAGAVLGVRLLRW